MRVLWLLGALMLTGCASASGSTEPIERAPALPQLLVALIAHAEPAQWLTTGPDQWEVWLCHVRSDTNVELYGGLQARLDVTVGDLTTTLNRFVPDYFAALSHRRYEPTFAAGGDVDMATDDQPQACLDRALDQSAPSTRGVIAIADAEHATGQIGGFGTQGGPCAVPPCAAAATRRGVYVGASDFSADWAERPPMDLVEHEMGHALGWAHSGYTASQSQPYTSGLDVMSNSAAPRDVDPERRDAADTLAINRLMAGWLPHSAVAVVAADGDDVTLMPSTGTEGTRLAVVGVNATQLLTIEVLSATGLDAHLPHNGVAVHRVTFDGALRDLEPLVGAAPFTDLLEPGESVTVDDWTITVLEGWVVRIVPRI